jgi:DNA-binding transcriptional MerR regulator
MTVLVPIGDFSRMTHLSVKALRFYHDQGLLEPARIDPSSGYRFYHSGQVPVAQVIRRFRDLDMPLDQVKAVLRAPDVETRTKEIIAHLSAMETKLAELQMSVSSLRALLEGPVVRTEVEFRSIPPARALAVRGTVSTAEAWAWGTDVFSEIYGRIEQAGLTPAGPDYMHGLRDQFPVPAHRGVYSASGMYLAAAWVSDPRAVIEHKLYWAPVSGMEEARYLTAILNSDVLTELVRPLQARGEHNPRDFDKYVFELPIPLYQPAHEEHRRLVALAEHAEQVAQAVELPSMDHPALRRRIRAALIGCIFLTGMNIY